MLVVFGLAFIAWGGVRIFSNIHAEQNYLGYLKQAADANTVELASEKLGTALKEIEKEGDTSGYTSVFYNTPNEDLGYWHKNLQSAYEELQKIPSTASYSNAFFTSASAPSLLFATARKSPL